MPVSDRNHFNLVRVIAALMVLVSHSYAIATGDPRQEPWQAWLGMSPGGLAVGVFFSLSGYLLTGSAERARSIKAYVMARAGRIYPALWLAVLLSALVVGLAFTTLSSADYFKHPQTWRYVLKNGLMILWGEGELPGAFTGNPLAGAVNGSLWTLRYELRLYVALAVIWFSFGVLPIALRARWRRFALLGLAAVLLCLHSLAVGGWIPLTKGLQLSTMFFAGSAYWLVSAAHPSSSPKALMVLAVLLLATAIDTRFFPLLLPLCLPYILVTLANADIPVLLHYNRLGDYSYGIYLYAFPVQQMLMAFRPHTTVWELTAAVVPITIALAVGSWHVLEKPAIRWTRRPA